ncbi:TIGR03088 family PEP-CTERM/XrtA system glycosyltransferase [Polaromonas sp. UC242_47]|uniref:TIGR03088 family PEP-CTERM/XrtA system glycosyltransferase n=1 Tax=Polaromonas sp. UC242_47 TaxID=3374626 RepID=UPI00378BA7AF
MSGQPRIFIVHVIHHLVIGGMENGVVNLINQLPKDRFKHAVVCIEDFSDFRDRIQCTDVEVYALHRSKIGSMRLRWQLFKLLRNLRPEIVHSRNLSGLDALLPAWLAGITTLHSEHGFDVDNLNGKAKKPALLRRLHAPLIKHYVTVSEHLRGLLIEELGIAANRVTQVYNGVDTERFVPQPRPRHELLPAVMLGEELFVLGTVGRVRPIKDHATLLQAIALLLARRPEWRLRLRLALVGDGPLLVELKSLADGLGIADLVWFAGARNDVSDLLQAMDLFVLPSLNEGISNTLLEAMATGLPVIATAVGGNVELVDVGVVGDTFLPGDAGRLAELIENYVADPVRSAAHGAAARRRVLRQFSLQAMVAAYQDIYQKL